MLLKYQHLSSLYRLKTKFTTNILKYYQQNYCEENSSLSIKFEESQKRINEKNSNAKRQRIGFQRNFTKAYPLFSQTVFSFSDTKQETYSKPVHSSHLNMIFSEPKEHQFILQLLRSFQKQSQKVKAIFQNNIKDQSSQQFSEILSSLNTLSQSINLFLLELQIEQMSEIDKWKWRGNEAAGKEYSTRQYRENLLTQIQERKLFYKRLEAFINNVVKELQAKFQAKISPVQQANDQRKIEKNSGSKLVQGDFFKHSFITENYTEIYDEVSQSKEEYLLRSKKLKSFSILKVHEFESNYALKIRLLIQILSQIKQIYQLFLFNQSKTLTPTQIEANYLPLPKFLSQTIISPVEYSQLLQVYYNQFSQKNIKNFLFMSVGYHSPEISQLSKELVDVKIRETNFDYNLGKLCDLYLIRQDQWLYNAEIQGISELKIEQIESKSYQRQQQQQQQQNYQTKYITDFKTHKEMILKYAIVVLGELKKEKQRQQGQSQELQLSQRESSQSGNERNSSSTPLHLFSEYKISFNQLIPHHFFTITDITQVQSLIQEEIIPLMLNPQAVYTTLVHQKLINQTQQTDRNKLNILDQQYLEKIGKFLRDADENMLFLSRFLEWNISMVIHFRDFLTNYYRTETQSILKQITHLNNLPSEAFPSQLPPYLITLFRITNILYNLNNHVNPIYVEDFINSIEFMSLCFKDFIEINICGKLGISAIKLFKTFDKVLGQLIQTQNHISQEFCPSLLRFRVLTIFLDSKLITYEQIFVLFLNSELLSKTSEEDYEKNAVFTFLYYSDGLERCLRIFSQFYSDENKKFRKLISTNKHFQRFANMLLKHQQRFNKVLRKLEFFEDEQLFAPQTPSQQRPQSLKEKNKQIEESQRLQQFLRFYEGNDLLHRRKQTDQETFINWMSKILIMDAKKIKHSTDQKQSKMIQATLPTNSRHNFDNPLNILLVLSQNTNFLSSSIKLSYFNYLKFQIKELYGFEKFESSWNYPFYADIAVTKLRKKSKKPYRLFIQTLATSGIRGRGRFFKEETSLKRNFMSFIDLNKTEEESKLLHAETKRKFYGVRSKNNDIIQLRIQIDRGQEMINMVKEWFEDKFEVVQKIKINEYDPKKYQKDNKKQF